MSQHLWSLLRSIQKNLIWAIPIIMLAGILMGAAKDMSFLKAGILPLTFLMVYPMMINLQIEKVFSKQGAKTQLAAQIINFGIIPFVAFGLGKIFFNDQPMIILGLLLAALLPTSGMTISWTGFAKGNINTAIQMTVVGLIIGSIATPIYAKLLMGEVIVIPLQQIFKQIAIIVFFPMLLGVLTRKIIINKWGADYYQKELKQKFPLLSTLGVLGIVFVAMALKANTILQKPQVLLVYLFPLLLLYGINFALSTLVSKLFFQRAEGIALVYGTVMRNLSIALAIAMTAFGEKGAEISIIIAMAYIIQVQSAAWYVKFTDKIFGEINNEASQRLKQA